DYQLMLRRKLCRQVLRFCSPKDAIDVRRPLSEWIDRIWPVGDQASTRCVVAGAVNRRQTIACRQSDDEVAMPYSDSMRCDDKAVIGPRRELRDGALDLSGGVHAERDNLDPQ